MGSKANELVGPVHNTHLTTIRRCSKKFDYAFIQGIQPITPSLPLARGIWLHYCLQAQFLRWGIQDKTLLFTPEDIHVDGLGKLAIDAKNLRMVGFEDDNEPIFYDLSAAGMLKLLTEGIWEQLFPQEHEKYTEDGATLPEATRKILEEYFYYWKDKYTDRDFEILLVEHTWQREHKGVEFEGTLDYVIRHKSSGRIICGDWKSTKSEPDPEYKFMESQLNLYAWGIAPLLVELGVDRKAVENIAVEFDYLSTKLPTKPQQNQDGSLSKRKINTTYLTLTRALKEYGLKWSKEQVEEFLANNSREFFSCKPFPRSKRVVKTLLDENVADSELIVRATDTPKTITRTRTKNCKFDCDFLSLCKGELYGHNVSHIRKTEFEPRQNTHAGVVEKDNE